MRGTQIAPIQRLRIFASGLDAGVQHDEAHTELVEQNQQLVQAMLPGILNVPVKG